MTYEELLAHFKEANHDLHEAHLEIERHHRDFEQISLILHLALDPVTEPHREDPDQWCRRSHTHALKRIRNIVG